MRLWKVLLIFGIVSSGFASGFLWKHMRAPSGPERFETPGTVAATAEAEPLPPGYDPGLILPPPDMRGVTLDVSGLMIKDHFKKVAGLPSALEPPLFDTPFGVIPVGAEAPAPDGVPERLPPVIRM